MSTFYNVRARGVFNTHDNVTLCNGEGKTLTVLGNTEISGKQLKIKDVNNQNDMISLNPDGSFVSQSLQSGTGTFNSNIVVGDSKFTVNSDGVVSVGSTLAVTGATTLTGKLNPNGGIKVNTDKFIVNSDGVVSVGSTLAVTGATTLTGILNPDGGINVNTNKFTVNSDGVVTAVGDVTFTSNLNVGGSAEFAKVVNIYNDLIVDGSITVKGDMITKSQQEINVGDSHIYLNAENTVVSDTSGGIVVNAKAIVVKTISSVVSNMITVSESDAADFAAGDIIQVSGHLVDATLNGLYVVESVNLKNITIKTSDVKAVFVKTAIPDFFNPDNIDSVKVAKVKLGHMMIDAEHNTIEFASGFSDSDFDHAVDTNYIKYTDRIETLENNLSSNTVDNRSNIQTITNDVGSIQYLDKRVVVVNSTIDNTNSVFLPPVASGGEGDKIWTSSHRVYNNTDVPITIMNKPSINNEDWVETYFFDRVKTQQSIVIESGESIQLQYVTDGVWITM